MLKKTRDKKWVLPNFQREFVWTADQIAGLFDSMARGYPIGAIILLKYHADYPFEARGLGGEEGAGEGHEFYIIDGQQRLTSLYKIINQYSSQAFDEESANHLALKKKPNSLDAPQNYTFFLNYGATKLTEKFICPQKQTKHGQKDIEMQEDGFVPLEYVFGKPSILDAYLKKHKIKSKKNKIIKFKNNILNYELTIKQCNANWDMDEYRVVFERLNSSGTNLSAFDECASILSKQKFKLHKKWKSVSTDSNFSAIKKLDVDPMYILKTMYVLNEIDDNKASIGPPSLRNLRNYFKASELAATKSAWDKAVKNVNAACQQLIDRYGTLDKRLIPYTPMIVTLASIMYYFKGQFSPKFGEAFNKKIDWWYWSSVFSKQYDKSTDNKIATHVKKLLKWTHPTKGEKCQWGDHKINMEDLRRDLGRLHNSTDARYKGILCLQLMSSKQDILGNTIKDFEDHHYFTKKNLSDLGLDWPKINNIANRMAIDKSSNASIGKVSPHEYKEHDIFISKTHSERYMIPPVDKKMRKISTKKYQQFLLARTDLIIGRIKKITAKN
jgi:hypothetical protein